MRVVLLLLSWSCWAGDVPSLERGVLDARKALESFDAGLNRHELIALKGMTRQESLSASPSLRKQIEERARLKSEVEFWEEAVRLKVALLRLPGAEEKDSLVKERGKEAEAIALTAMKGFRDLKEKFEMVRPAILHNLLVNVGLKEEGLCWQWTRGLMKELLKLDVKTYDLRWATAREGTLREHNTVVVVVKDRPLEDGLVIDGWTHSGKPFWIRVTDDKKHPWKPGAYAGDDLNINSRATPTRANPAP